MTFQETTKIMAVFRAAYPRYYANIDVEEARRVTTLWASMLADYSYETVSNAAKALIVSSKFPPTIAEVIEKIQLLTKEPELTEGEAWSMVRKAIRNGIYGYKEEYRKLPDKVKTAIGNPLMIHEWAKVSADELDTVVASNFMRNFRSQTKSKQEYESLPQSVKKFVEEISAKMPKLEEVNESEGWELLAHTFDLHHQEDMMEGNVMTEYEEKFSSMGNPICKLIAVLHE